MELSVYPFDEEETILYRLSKELKIPFWLLELEEKKFTAVAVEEEKRMIHYRDRTEEVKNSRDKTSLDYVRYHKENPDVWEEMAANGVDVMQLRDRLKEEISLEKKTGDRDPQEDTDPGDAGQRDMPGASLSSIWKEMQIAVGLL